MEHALETVTHGPLAVTPVGYLWLIPLFPLIGAVLNVTIGWWLQRKLGKRVVHGLAITSMAASLAVAVYAFFQLYGLPAEERFLQDTLWNVLTAGRVKFDLAFALDPLGMMMVLVITFIGSLIHVFSVGYMADEKSYWRFFAYLNLFVFSMLLLVMGDNFMLMFFGWEGVGLCSYLLISFWYTDSAKAAAGMKAFITNRFGDLGFTLGVFALFWALGGVWQKTDQGQTAYHPAPALQATAGATNAEEADRLAPVVAGVRLGPTLNLRELRDQIVVKETGVANELGHQTLGGVSLLALVCILLFVGAMGKSAQLPLHVWLPDAMAGPTPVSALIHAATMVTAGVYMVARLNFVFVLSPTAMGWVALVGALTAIFAASIGFFQYDIKKVLAYSTVSQLGFMFIGVGVGAYWAGAYHLLTHAFFKATLFLGSGSVILGCHHEQDMRKMGGLAKHMPITRWTYWIACVAISGFPLASGFYSKDEILYKAFASEHLALPFIGPAPWLGTAIYMIGIIAATGTAFYMWRSYYMTFSGEYRGAAHGHGDSHGEHGHHGGTPHESPACMTGVLAVLAGGAVLASLLGLPALWTGHAPVLEHWLEPSLTATAQVPFAEHSHGTEWLFQIIGVSVGLVGWFAAMRLYKDAKSPVPAAIKERFAGAWKVVFNKYYVDELYQLICIRPAVAFARACSWVDRCIVDWIVNFVGALGRFVAAIDGAIDKHLVDGMVNLVAGATIAAGRSLRHVQTGRVQTYLYGALAGALAIVAVIFLAKAEFVRDALSGLSFFAK